jgi:hypothetical protein
MNEHQTPSCLKICEPPCFCSGCWNKRQQSGETPFGVVVSWRQETSSYQTGSWEMLEELHISSQAKPLALNVSSRICIVVIDRSLFESAATSCKLYQSCDHVQGILSITHAPIGVTWIYLTIYLLPPTG